MWYSGIDVCVSQTSSEYSLQARKIMESLMRHAMKILAIGRCKRMPSVTCDTAHSGDDDRRKVQNVYNKSCIHTKYIGTPVLESRRKGKRSQKVRKIENEKKG